MGADPVRVPEAVRPLYHAALAHGANHLDHAGARLRRRPGARRRPPAERLVAPLLSAALDNALRHGDRALTGPVARGDAGTVRTHLRELGAVDPDLAATYRVLAARTARRAQRAGLLPLMPPTSACRAHVEKEADVVTTAQTRGGYTPGELTVHTRPAAISPVTRALRSAGRRIALVPTMGALHEGHRELIRHARRMPGAGVVAVSIFVNPLQFGPAEDLARYPRPLEADLQICRDEGVELVFAPVSTTCTPPGRHDDRRSRAARRRAGRCGPARPLRRRADRGREAVPHRRPGRRVLRREGLSAAGAGHEDGRRPELPARRGRCADRPRAGRPRALLAQRLPLARASSVAATLQRALAAGAAVSARGPEAVLSTARAVLDAEPEIDVDYLELRDPDLGRDPQAGRARLLVAARLGTTRLIDNIAVAVGPAPLRRHRQHPDRAGALRRHDLGLRRAPAADPRLAHAHRSADDRRRAGRRRPRPARPVRAAGQRDRRAVDGAEPAA